MCAGVSLSERRYKKQHIRHKEGCSGIHFLGIPFRLFIIRITGFLEQVANGAAQEVAEPVKVLKTYGFGLVRDHAVEVLVA